MPMSEYENIVVWSSPGCVCLDEFATRRGSAKLELGPRVELTCRGDQEGWTTLQCLRRNEWANGSVPILLLWIVSPARMAGSKVPS